MPVSDSIYPECERIPRRLDVNFSEDNKGRVATIINGKKVGKPLYNENYYDDGFRFRNIFYISYATFLGWSPNLRALLKCKRKSNSVIDDAEDGGRAIVSEGGICEVIFTYAENHSFLKGISVIDGNLLRRIKETLFYLEVDICTEFEWEEAILKGFAAYREIWENKGGNIYADLDERILFVR